jgi:hypothetical protein
MKKIMSFIVVIVLNCITAIAYAQSNDEPVALGLPGDNLNLYAVLDVFQKSKTLEDFEKSVNAEENKINNLDLNNDNKTDYIQVNSEKKGETFFVILQVSVSKTEKQDVAVIEIDKDKSGKVNIQVIGDEELYGKDYIIEPSQNESVAGTPNPGYSQGTTTIINNNTTNNNTTNNSDRVGPTVSVWPVVLYLFSPLFVPWHSPWYWGYYPSYWRPWRPYYYRTYWGYHRRYYVSPYYRRAAYYRNNYYRGYYYNRRTYSNTVRRYKSDNRYRGTYQGVAYKRPTSPVVRPGNMTRPSAGNRYPNNTRPGTSTSRYPSVSTRPGNVNNRYPNTTRPGSSSNNYPNATRPNTSNTRPTTRPSNNSSNSWPVTKPSQRPVSWPSSNTSRPSTRPATRPSSGSMSRPSGGNRASRGGRS